MANHAENKQIKTALYFTHTQANKLVTGLNVFAHRSPAATLMLLILCYSCPVQSVVQLLSLNIKVIETVKCSM